MCLPFSERLLALQLLYAKTDGRGFRCERCDCTEFVQPRHRPRAVRCTSCKCQRSVTSGTALQNTKLSLFQWMMIRYSWADNGLPSCTTVARAARISRSSAWHANQRALRAFFRDLDRTLLGNVIVNFRCRKPKGSATYDANPRYRQLLTDFRQRLRHRDRVASFRINNDEFPGRLVDGPDPGPGPLPEDERGADSVVRDLIEAALHDRHQCTCLRWAERYADYYLHRWGLRLDPLPYLLHAPKRSLAELRI